MFKIIVTLFAALALSGCAGMFKSNTVYVTKVTTPDDILLINCDITPPPSKEDYLKADMSGRELMLVQHSSVQMKNLFKCNDRFGKLRSWKKEVEALEIEQK